VFGSIYREVFSRNPQHSVRINDQWRVCFDWNQGDTDDVEIVNYHSGRMPMRAKKLKPVHPGEILLEEFLKAMNVSQNRLALPIGVPPKAD
jgi:hypothetical protein